MRVIVEDSANTRLSRKTRWRLRWLLIILVISAVAGGGFVLWALTPAGTLMPEALDALRSDDRVTVIQREWLVFLPHDAPPQAGLVFYPGARVAAAAYAPLARQIAEAGYLVVIIRPTLNIPLFSINAAASVIETYAPISRWVIAGHSLGGTAAAYFVARHPANIGGLVLIASYPTNDQLRTADVAVLSIYGTEDALTTETDIAKSQTRLPSHTQYMAVAGGNHSQFGYYGFQRGDRPAQITREAQTRQTAAAILNLLLRDLP